jgi:ATP-dependent DNA helicase RecQ
LNLLHEAGAVTSGKRGVRLTSKAKLSALVRDAVGLTETRQRVDQSRLNMMRAYAETDGCRRQFLLGYFGEHLPQPCGNCDACAEAARQFAPAGQEHPGVDHDGGRGGQEQDVPFPLQSTVTHKSWGPGLVMRYEDDVITVLFEREGYKTLSRKAVMKRKLLKPA